MKPILALLFFGFTITSFAQSPKTIHITTHNKITIITNPATGENPYQAWGVFPAKGEPVRKIMMHVTLGTPDSIQTAHWDYLDRINIVRTGGRNNEALNLELGRMLTPYGSLYREGWSFSWSVDVTDFSMILRDSVEIEYIHTGYEPVSTGWALTIDFEIVPGPPHIIPISIQPMWRGSFNYGNPAKPIEKELTPIQYAAAPGSVINRLRLQHTGHGSDRPRGCSEFCSRWRRVKFNGTVVQEKDLWKKCGNNPLYPQGGTWVYDRALWCPGDLQQPDIIDVYPAPGRNTFEIEMEPYTATANIQAQESIGSCLIQYSAPVNKNDVSVENIITPNSRPLYDRSNPKCFDARITIRNLGSNNLKSLTISYGTAGFPMKNFHWSGDLPYYHADEVTLPGSIDFSGTINVFVVECTKPNGKPDAWDGDNALTSTFNSPIELPEKFIVQYRTNATPRENNVFIVNQTRDTLYHKSAGSLKPETLYADTLQLPEALYEMYLTDSGGDGLEFWNKKRQGYGYIRILDMQGSLIYKFTADCGAGEMLAFRTNPRFAKDPGLNLCDFILFPKVVTDTFALEVFTAKEVRMEVLITALGIPVEKHFYPKIRGGKIIYDISHLPDDRYIIEVFIDGVRKYTARINKSKRRM